MKKFNKVSIVLILAIIFVLLLSACGSSTTVKGTYYLEKADGTLDESSWIELSGKNWTDSDALSGTFEKDGNTIRFLIEGEELFSGTLEDGVLTIDFFGTAVYRKEAANPSETPMDQCQASRQYL